MKQFYVISSNTLRYFPALALLLITVTATAQQRNKPSTGTTHLQAAAIAKAYEDSVLIRWAPASPEAWIIGNQAGYHLTRIDITDSAHPVKTDLGPQQILPMPEKQLRAGLDTTNEKTKYLVVAAKMLYGKQYTTSRAPAKSFMQQTKNQHGALVLRYMIALMAADYYPPAADVLGLRWVDRNVRKGGKYIYTVTYPIAGKHYVMDSAATFVLNVKAGKDPVPQGLEVYGYDKKTELRWNRRQNGHFSGYYIERSDDGGKNYHTLNKTPFNSFYTPPTGDKKKDSLLMQGKNTILRDQQVFNDSIPQNYKNYYYRVRAINGFGELSPYSEAVAIQGRDLTPPTPPVIDSVKNIEGNLVKIWWTSRNTSPDLAGYYVNKGASKQGPFHAVSKNMLDKNTRSFIDSSSVGHQANYYVLIAADTAKNLSVSIPALVYLKDSFPPAAPSYVTGVIDSNGIVRLHWKRNTESDMLGYQVYSSYRPDYQFSQVTHAVLTDTIFMDTVSMKSLERQVYYKIVALDKNYNHSPFSATASIKKPVVIPPSPPVAGNISIAKSKVTIEWIESRSEGATGYQLYRKEKGRDWMVFATLKQDWHVRSLHYTDTSIAANTDYYYAAETIDSSGIRSEKSFAVHVRSSAANTLQAISNLQATLDRKQHRIQLNWQYKDTGDYFFVVYRAVNNGTLDPWHSFEKNTLSGADSQLKNGNYLYAIKVVYRSRAAESAISKPVAVNVSSE